MTDQRNDDRTVPFYKGHGLKDRGEDELLVLSGKNQPSILSRADGLPVFHRPEPLSLVKAKRFSIRRRVDVVIYHAGSRSQPQIVLHFVAPSVSSRRSWRAPS
jgi:hypothetical protein